MSVICQPLFAEVPTSRKQWDMTRAHGRRADKMNVWSSVPPAFQGNSPSLYENSCAAYVHSEKWMSHIKDHIIPAIKKTALMPHFRLMHVFASRNARWYIISLLLWYDKQALGNMSAVLARAIWMVRCDTLAKLRLVWRVIIAAAVGRAESELILRINLWSIHKLNLLWWNVAFYPQLTVHSFEEPTLH